MHLCYTQGDQVIRIDAPQKIHEKISLFTNYASDMVYS